MNNKFDGTLSSVARSQAVERLRTNEALEEEAKDSRELLRDILKDITSDNMLSPDVFDRLVSEVKRYE